MYAIEELPKLEVNYDDLSDEKLIELAFEFVENRTEIPEQIVSRLKQLLVWDIVKPLLEEDDEFEDLL